MKLNGTAVIIPKAARMFVSSIMPKNETKPSATAMGTRSAMSSSAAKTPIAPSVMLLN